MSAQTTISPPAFSHHLNQPAGPMTREQALDRARALTPRIRARAARTEMDRRVPDQTIAELLRQGLFGIVTPREFGGSELGLASLVEVTSEIASACGSSGWVFGVLAGHSWLLNLFPVEAQREVFGDPLGLIATVFRLAGNVTPVEGGYRLIAGEGRFCSGIDHAKWVIVGNAVKRGDGVLEPRFFIVPRTDIQVIDDWHTSGMRGTGSRSIRIADAFIPEHRSVSAQEMMDGTGPGARFHRSALYRMSYRDVVPFSIIGAPIGMGRGAVQSFVEGFRGRTSGVDNVQVAEHCPTFMRVAQAMTDLDAAYALVMDDAGRIDRATDPTDLTDLDRARIPRDWAFAAQKSRYAVTSIFEAGGGSGVYNSSDLQRMWRDVNSASQHSAFGWDQAMASFGRAALGFAPPSPGMSGR